MLALLPSVQPVEENPPGFLSFQHVTGALQDHHLKDDEPISVPTVILESIHIHGQRMDKYQNELPS